MKVVLSFGMLFLLTISISATGQHKNASDTPIKTVERIFKNYIKYAESTDTEHNKNAVSKALKALQQSSGEKDLPLLINVWMYYDPTDFSTRKLIEPIFYKNKKAAIKAITERIKNKKNWEKNDTAPFTDLFALKDKLVIAS